MDSRDLIARIKNRDISRRDLLQGMSAAGLAVVMTPAMSHMAKAAAADQATYFTWGGYDVPEFVGPYIAKHGEAPNFATFGGSEEGLTKMLAGYVVDVAHPCNQGIPRWVATWKGRPAPRSPLSWCGQCVMRTGPTWTASKSSKAGWMPPARPTSKSTPSRAMRTTGPA